MMLDTEPDSYEYSRIEQVFVGVHPVYSPPSGVYSYLADTDEGRHICEDCGDEFLFESSLTYHKDRTTVSIEYNCEECCHKLSFYNRCNFLSHLRQHNFDLSKKDFSNVDFSLFNLPLSKLECPSLPNDDCQGIEKNQENPYHSTTNATKYRSDDEQNSNCSSSTSGFASEAHSMKSVEMSTRQSEKSKSPARVCPECRMVLVFSLAEHYWAGCKPQYSYFQCKHCKLNLPSKCCLAAHTRVHRLEKPFICPECGITFKEQSHFSNHIHEICCHSHRTLQYRCKLCFFFFEKASSLHKHISLRHTDSDIYICDHCNNEFSSKLVLKQHLWESHNIEMSRWLVIAPCKYCQFCQNTVAKRKYINHVLKHCNSSLCYAYQCSKCSRVFGTQDDFKHHQLLCCKSTKDKHLQKPTSQALIQYKGTDVSNTKRLRSDVHKSTSSATLGSENGNTYRFGKVVDGKFQCKLCNEVVPLSNESLQSHFVTIHKISKNIVLEPAKIIQRKIDIKVTTSNQSNNEGPSTNKKPSRVTRNFKIMNPDKRPAKALEHDSLDSENSSPTKKSRQSKCGSRLNFNKPSSGIESVPSRSLFSPRKLKKNSVETDQSKICTEGDQTELTQTDSSLSCLKCQFSTDNVDIFKKHIKEHRAASDFQCMECGLCFITKPSFNIHLIMTHKIKDVEMYIDNNDCCNLQIVENEISEPAKDVSEEEIPPVLQENQCSICFKVCDSALNLSNHFRTHGMAYLLMKKRQGLKTDTSLKSTIKI